MFFEPRSNLDESAPPPEPKLPDWIAPPTDETGVVVTTSLILARTPNIAIALPMIRSYRTGCLLDLEIILRQGDLSASAFSDLRSSIHPTALHPEPSPATMMRLGVRYADGTKVSTLLNRGKVVRFSEDGRPSNPLLSWQPTGDQLHGSAPHLGHNTMKLWLWPLPPAEPFELGVEWPGGGIELSVAELDGAAIEFAAQQSVPCWPDHP
ncbi:hypothetical protein ABGB14_37370 [Nonomuraea sp. B10E15]|uniref:hypothetical protein n=1 Tax=Nonomuraea sp. B10E15 TaxID=3153560 RepID=UPI00325E73B5